MLASSIALTRLVTFPLCRRLLPATVDTPKTLVLSGLGSVGVALFWFVERHSAYVWPLQDMLCVCLCFVFIDSIQLPR